MAGKVLEKVKAGERTTTRALEGGSGQGLIFIRETLSNYKGSMDVESELGQGTMFRIMIPVERAAEIAGESVSEGRDMLRDFVQKGDKSKLNFSYDFRRLKEIDSILKSYYECDLSEIMNFMIKLDDAKFESQINAIEGVSAEAKKRILEYKRAKFIEGRNINDSEFYRIFYQGVRVKDYKMFLDKISSRLFLSTEAWADIIDHFGILRLKRLYSKEERLADKLEEMRADKAMKSQEEVASELIARFIHVPGIERIVAKLLTKNTDGHLGTFEELYHAALLEDEGYAIVAFDVEIKRSSGPNLLQIDLVVRKNQEYYFVEVKHLSTHQKPKSVARKIRITENGHKIFENYRSFFEGLQNLEEGDFYAKQLKEKMGTAADDLINKFKNDKKYKAKVVLSISLTFGKEFSKEDRNKYMLRLVSNLGIYSDCLAANIIPTVIVRYFVNSSEAADKKIFISGELKEVTLRESDEAKLKTTLSRIMKASYFVTDGNEKFYNVSLKDISAKNQRKNLEELFDYVSPFLKKYGKIKIYYLLKADQAMETLQWDGPIQRMLDNGYKFLPEKMQEPGFVFRGVEGGVIEGLINGEFTYQSNKTPSTDSDPSEKKLGIYYVSHWISEGFIFGSLFNENGLNKGILIIPSSFFNQEYAQGRAAVHAKKFTLYRFPFFTRPIPAQDVTYILVNARLKKYLDDVKAGHRSLNAKEKDLQKALIANKSLSIIQLPEIESIRSMDDLQLFLENKIGVKGVSFIRTGSVPTNVYPGHESDAAQLTKGGIDLNPAQMNLQVKREGDDFKFDFNGTTIDAASVIGATFTIRTMTPVTNLSLILGLNP